jgi:nucleoside phosphorylase
MTPTIGIVTALAVEGAAVHLLVDGVQPEHGPDDPNHYHRGWLPGADPDHPHRVVTTILPQDGTRGAAAACTDLLRSFPSVRCVVMCGIAGGIPAPDRPDQHVRLGDVVVGTDGIVDYGHVWRVDGTEELRRAVTGMSADLLRAARALQSAERLGRRPWEQWLATPPAGFDRPRRDPLTIGGRAAAHPDRRRSGHPVGLPKVHYAAVGSTDQLLRDERRRNELAGKYYIRAVEMETAGIAAAAALRGVHWFVVRGIADYCDVHKDNRWHPYASLAAAAYVRALLAACPCLDRPAPPPAAAAAPRPAPTGNGRIPTAGLRALVDTLQTIPAFLDDHQRYGFARGLPPEIRGAIGYQSAGRQHIVEILQACARFPLGRTAFLEAAGLALGPGSAELDRVERVVAEHWP